MKTVIFANGELSDPLEAKALISGGDLIIAADGGSIHCETLGITPKLIIGDLDSIPKNILDKSTTSGIEIIRHEADKDQTDLELALLYALDASSEHVLILGGLGNRWDHSIANLLLAANHEFAHMQISFYSDGDWFFIVSDQLEISGVIGQTVSILPLGGDALGVSSIGLKWQLNNENLPHGSSRGVSNLLSSNKATITVQDGILLIIQNKN